MISLRKITSENCEAICKLNADNRFVATNTESLVEAYAHYSEHGIGPIAYGIYSDDTPVGFIMAEYNNSPEENDGMPYYYLWRMMIDNDHQRKGYGKAALDLMVQELRTHPQGKADKFFTSYVPGDDGPMGFYAKYGFTHTGEMVEDEVEMVFEL